VGDRHRAASAGHGRQQAGQVVVEAGGAQDEQHGGVVLGAEGVDGEASGGGVDAVEDAGRVHVASVDAVEGLDRDGGARQVLRTRRDVGERRREGRLAGGFGADEHDRREQGGGGPHRQHAQSSQHDRSSSRNPCSRSASSGAVSTPEPLTDPAGHHARPLAELVDEAEDGVAVRERRSGEEQPRGDRGLVGLLGDLDPTVLVEREPVAYHRQRALEPDGEQRVARRPASGGRPPPGR
jgi:hypothetical protein